MRKLEPWRLLHSIYAFSDRWLTLRHDTVRLPSGSTLAPYHVIEAADWVNVIAVSQAGCILLIEQYRHAVGHTMLEIPAGHVEPDETPETAARRELQEETGYTGGRWSLLATLSANPALQNNLVYTFLAEGVTAGASSPEASEEITVHLTPLDQIEALIDNGGFLQALHAAPLLKVLLRRAHARDRGEERAR